MQILSESQLVLSLCYGREYFLFYLSNMIYNMILRRHQTEDAVRLKRNLNCEEIRYLEGVCFIIRLAGSRQDVRLILEIMNHESGTMHVGPVRTGVVCKRERANAVKDEVANARRQHKSHS